jgi:hypothetical protein
LSLLRAELTCCAGSPPTLMPQGSAPSEMRMSHTSRKNREIEKTINSSKKTYQCRGEDQLVKRAVRPL